MSVTALPPVPVDEKTTVVRNDYDSNNEDASSVNITAGRRLANLPIFFKKVEKTPFTFEFEWLNNFSCVLTESCGHRRQKFDTVVYFPAIDSIAGDVLPLSCFKKI
jgi:hypothetical protein